MYQIEELPDLKVAWHESYKCLNELLLEYVWEVANHFLPDYAENRYGNDTRRIFRACHIRQQICGKKLIR